MNGLQLVVTKNIVGELETNIGVLEKFVLERLKSYTPEQYEGDAVNAKKDRAELNSAKAQIAESRKNLMKELMKPYADFESRCKKLESDIDMASSKLDVIVKAREAQEKEAKRVLIQEMWNCKGFELFPLEKVLNPKWLNKTAKMKDIENEMDVIIKKSYADLKLLETVPTEYAEIAKSKYLECLDVSEAFEFTKTLEKNRAVVEKESEERADREHNERIAEQRKALVEENKDVAKKSKMSSLVADALEVEPEAPSVKEWVISFSGTETQMLAVKNYLVMQGIECNSCEEIKF